MSSFGDALKGIRQVLQMQATVEHLERDVDKLAGDVESLASAHGALRERVSRLEGFIEGAAVASRSPPRLPQQ